MTTALKLRSSDHGKPLTFDEFLEGNFEEGFHYEIIAGRLYVTPAPNLSHDRIVTYISQQLLQYSRKFPDVINYVTQNARVFIQNGTGVTAPEPDIAVYCNFPENEQIDWNDVSPLLVVEVLGGLDEEKDLERNVDLYRRVSSIQEYWIFDIRKSPKSPSMHVYGRKDESWDQLQHGLTESYSTGLLPGFLLSLSPAKH